MSTPMCSHGHAMKNGGEVVARALIPAYVTEGIHPTVLAVSNTLGNLWHGRAATATNGKKKNRQYPRSTRN
jgi:cytochrome c peroxidase